MFVNLSARMKWWERPASPPRRCSDRRRSDKCYVTAHIFADVLIAVGVAFLHARDRRHDLSGRAVAALEGILVDKGLLHRMQFVALRQSLDGENLLALGGQRQRKARDHAPPVDQYRAGAALPVV